LRWRFEKRSEVNDFDAFEQRPLFHYFHVYYNEYRGIVNIRTCEFIEGDIPRRQARLVLAWAELHQEELMADWNLVINGEEPFKIQPLQ
jgi:hypothetical protein